MWLRRIYSATCPSDFFDFTRLHIDTWNTTKNLFTRVHISTCPYSPILILNVSIRTSDILYLICFFRCPCLHVSRCTDVLETCPYLDELHSTKHLGLVFISTSFALALWTVWRKPSRCTDANFCSFCHGPKSNNVQHVLYTAPGRICSNLLTWNEGVKCLSRSSARVTWRGPPVRWLSTVALSPSAPGHMTYYTTKGRIRGAQKYRHLAPD